MSGNTKPRIGSLFSGYGGLDLAVAEVLAGETVWHAEIEAAPSAVLAARWPDVPNIGDVTAVDWTTVPRVEVLTGGFPCQDVSSAGKRAGMRAGTRSGLWARMVDAIETLRPPLVVAENVRGLLSAEADSAVEPCAGCVGDGPGAHLRALGRVLGDLADLGYDCRWYGLRAADVGAPHGRFRIFIVAANSDDGAGHGQRSCTELGQGIATTTDPTDIGHERRRPTRRWGTGSPNSGRTATYATFAERRGTESEHLGAATKRTAEPRERAGAAPDADRAALRLEPVAELGGSGAAEPGHPVRWGQYEPAIRRWERRLGRVAPAPTETAPKGGQRLSPRFVEWMQGLPAGWVTDVPGITRNEQLRMLGNGVVPQQAAHALRLLIPAAEVSEVAS